MAPEKPTAKQPNDPPSVANVIDKIATVHGNTVEIKPEVSSQILQFLTQAGYIAGAAKLASLPAPELNIGGGAFLAIGLIVADLHATGGKGPAVLAAKKIFGSVPNALLVLGVAGCTTLGGVTFYRMVKDGGINDPKDPRWLIVAGNFGPYLAGNLMNEPRVKNWVEKRFGKTIELAYREGDKTRHMTVDTVLFYQQLAFAMGAAHILAAGIIQGDLTTTMIASSFLAAPAVAAGNMLKPVQEDLLDENWKKDRRGFLTAVARLVVKPTLSADGNLLLDNVMAMIGRGEQHSKK